MKVGYSKKFVSFLFARYLFMKSIGWNLASVIVATLLIPFLIHTDVKAQTTVDICSRTDQVETAILAAINGVDPAPDPAITCTTATDTQLAAITELDLGNKSILSLKSGDFDGLTGLTILRLHNNTINSLPANIFTDLTNLRTLNLSLNNLSSLPAGLFNGLTNLVGVDVGRNPRLDTTNPSMILTATLKMTEDGMAAVEIAQGVPFTSVTATLSIDGGTFDDPQTGSGVTRIDDTQLQATITTGQTQSAEFAYTVTETAPTPDTPIPETRISITAIASVPGDILNGLIFQGFVWTGEGYDNFELATGDPLVITNGICSRTQQVQDEIVSLINDPDQSPTPPTPAVTCDTVTADQLTAITDTLDLGDPTFVGDTDDITELKAGDFAGLSGVTRLILSDNSLSTLPANIFAGLSSLTVLHLNGNSLSMPNKDAFDGLMNLQRLTLSINSLSALDKDIFNDLTNLRVLLLDGNSLSALDPDIFDGLTNLRELFLDGNSLSTLDPDIFNDLTNLTVLSLTNNDLMELPAGIFSGLQNLQGVSVSGNPEDDSDPFILTVTPKMISDDMAVIEVVEGVPFELTATVTISGGTFGDVTTMDVMIETGSAQSDPFPFTPTPNEIATVFSAAISSPMNDEIDDDFTTDSDTDSFIGYSGFELAAGDPIIFGDGICNRTQQVQDGILATSSVMTALGTSIAGVEDCNRVTNALLATITGELDVSDPTPDDGVGETDDDITELQSGDFAGLSGVTTLLLSDNALTTLPAGVFNGLTAVTELQLQDNTLMTLEAGAFNGLSALESVDLSENSLSMLNGEVFGGLTSLTTLDLSENSLSTLDKDIFNGLSALESVDLSENDLMTLPRGIFSGLRSLVGVDVSDNPNSGNSLTLTVTPKMISDDMAVIEVVHDVPFRLTATLSITGGTFSGNSTTTATIRKGRTQSNPFAYTLTDLSAVITVTISSPMNDEIDDDFTTDSDSGTSMGYSGFQLASGPALTIEETGGICTRTRTVRDAIVAAVNETTPNPLVNCLTVTEAQLRGITELLLNDQSIASLKSGDFAGLDFLFVLDLTGNSLSTLPADIFEGLTTLNTLALGSNDLTALPGGVFSGLTSLTNLLFSDNELTELPRGIFSGLPSLVGLNAAGNTTDPLPLNVTLQETTIGMAVVEIPQSVPFTSVTVNLEISGGTFGSGTDTTLSVTLDKGDIRSSEFAFTVPVPTAATPMPEATISISSTASNPTEIADGFFSRMGYSGLTLVSGDDLVRRMGICSRTAAVQTAILAAITPTDCAMVTIDDLRGITGTLDLMSESITALKSGDFAGLTSLETLDLVDNSLTDLPATIFAGLTALTRLDLSQNSLSMLPADIFRGLESLTVLTLNSNSLTMLDADIFDGLDALMELELSTNSLGTLDADIFDGLSALENLNLLSTGLTALDTDIFDGLDALTVLNLNSNSLETLDADIFNRLSSLIFLNLGSNNLTALPRGIFSGLTNLMAVEVSGNPSADPDPFTLTVDLKESGDGSAVIEVVEGVPFQVTATVSISDGTFSDSTTTMDVMIEKGKTQSDEFTYIESDLLTIITVSNLRSNPSNIETGFIIDTNAVGFFSGYSGFELAIGDPLIFGDGICSRTAQVQTAILAALNGVDPAPDPAVTCEMVTTALLAGITGTLNFHSQNITALMPDDFAGLTGLTRLRLSSNPLGTTLTADIFSDLSKLSVLQLRNCGINMLPAGIFSGLSRLGNLDLSDNNLTELPSGIFSGLTNMQVLFLDDNDLTTLDGDIFNDFSMLGRLDLRNNNLMDLPAGLFSGLTSLTGVGLSGNPEASPALLTLTATPVVTLDPSGGNPGMAVIEIPQGVPFANVMATVEIIGGEFSVGVTTTNVTIQKGQTRSAEFSYTPTPDEIATVLTVTISNPTNTTIDDDYDTNVGYGGFELVGAPLIFGDGICDRTEQVQTRILATTSVMTALGTSIAGVDDCNRVTNALLEGISGTLSFLGSPVGSLTAGDFAGLSEVTDLNLTFSLLSALPSGVFSGLTSLTTLNLSGNNLTESGVAADVFSDLANTLTTLHLNSNDFTTLPDGIFNGLGMLQTLYLNNNELTTLPAGIFSNLTSLIAVDVSQNPTDNPALFTLTATPVSIAPSSGGNPGMAVIEVVQGVPFDFAATVEIAGGTLAAAATTMNVTIDKGSTRSTPFEYTADPNDIATVLTVTPTSPMNSAIDDGFALSGGYSGFELATAPLSFGDGICTRTEQVQDAILDEISSLTGPTAEDCRLVTNDLLSMIGTLSLSSTPVVSLQAGDFAGLSAATTLTLTLNNNLTTLPSGVFRGLTNLRTLSLTFSDLTETGVAADAFSDLADTLTTLNLSNNNFTELPAGLFSSLGMLQKLDLSNNLLSMLPAGIFNGLTNLIGVNVSGNPKTSPALLSLTATPIATTPSSGGNPGMAVIEVVEGVPFDFTATVSIRGGTLAGGMTTMENVMIDKGSTRSTEFEYTADPDDIATVLTVTPTSPMNSEIAAGYREIGEGYGGFELVGAPLIFGRGICDRTPAVQDTILAISEVATALGTSIAGVEDCNRVTNELLAPIGTLNLGGQTITALQSGDFAGLTNMSSLLLNNTSLETLPADIFANLNALSTLLLNDNSLGSGTLPANVFAGLSNLGTLRLNDNSLETLPANVFAGLSTLITLNLSSNTLETLDAALFASLTALTDLNLSNNALISLPGGIFSGVGNVDFNGLANLEFLDLGSNALPTLPDGLFSGLTNLQAVNVRDNPAFNSPPFTLTATLEEIDDGMAVVVIPQGVPFTSVTATLSITGGTFTNGNTATLSKGDTQSAAFEFTIAQTADTTVIEITALTPVPSDIASDFTADMRTGYSGFTLAEGPQLTIQRNICNRTPRIRDAIVDAINAMPSESGVTCETATDPQIAAIPSLDLSDPTPLVDGTGDIDADDNPNDITTFLPGDLDGLSGLTTLTLNDNQLTTLPAGIFSQLTALESLTINNNGLTGLLPADIFNGLPLTTLRLADNALTELPVAILSSLTGLTTLDLSNNGLTSLPAGLFSGLADLTTLDLEGNALTDLPDGIFRNLGSLTGVDVSGQVDSGGNAITFSPLTITLEESGVGMAVIGLAQGVPFTSVTATLSIAGGTFVNGTNADNTETEVTIAKGEIRSSAFEFIVAQPTIAVPLPEATLTIADTASNPSEIENGFTDPTGYSGFTLASGSALTVQIGVCNRTPEVQTAIVDAINAMPSESGVTCDTVTVARLEAIDDTLSVSNQSIAALLSGDFAGLTNLTTLILSENNTLTTLPADVFNPLTSLETLVLNENTALITLESAIFGNLTTLTTLLLNDNGLTTLDASVFGTLTALTSLELNDNGLTMLDGTIFASLTALTFLNLSDNALTGLPAGIFSSLTDLTTLDFSGNRLTSLPGGIFSGLEMLTGVNASGQRDTNGDLIPDPLPLTVTLQEISEGMVVVEVAQGVPFTSVTATLSITGGDFSGNPTTTATLSKGEIRSSALAFTIDQAAEMTVLTVSSLISDPQNILTGYGPDIDRNLMGYSGFGFAEVPQLDIRRNICNRTPQVQAAILNAINAMDGVSDVTCETATAEQLAAITTPLTILDIAETEELRARDFEGLSGVTELTLLQNGFTSLPDGVFSGLSALESLSMNLHRNLTSLPDGIFSELTSLVSLNLASNALMSVSAQLFAGLTSLTSLELGANQLSGLDANTFSSLSGLTRLGLASNDLASLDGDEFAGLSGLETLDLSDNELMSLA